MAEHSEYEPVDWTIRHPDSSTPHIARLQHRPPKRDSAGCVEGNESAKSREGARRDTRNAPFCDAPDTALGGVANRLAAG
jgi:hypothetical protein